MGPVPIHDRLLFGQHLIGFLSHIDHPALLVFRLSGVEGDFPLPEVHLGPFKGKNLPKPNPGMVTYCHVGPEEVRSSGISVGASRNG